MPNPAQRRDQLLAFSRVARITQGKHDNLFSVDVLLQEGQRGRLASDHPDVEFVRHRLSETGELGDDGLRLGEREGNESAEQIWPDRMELELEAGDDTEIPTATTQSPEKIGVFGFAGAHLVALSGDDIRGEQVVDGHPVLPAQPAKAAAEGQAGHARGRVDAERRREAMRLSDRIEIGERAAGLDGRSAGGRVHLNALHQREVDHETVVANGIARDVVAAPADRDEQVVRARELDRLDDIVSRPAARDQRRLAIDRRVPDLSDLVVTRVARKKHVSPEARFEPINHFTL